MYILAALTENSIPKTGLLPKIKIRNIPAGTVLVNNDIMSELGDGFYYYNFSGYDATKDYAILCDGTNVLPNSERYIVAGNENYLEDISKSSILQRIVGLMHENIYIDNPVYDNDNNLITARVRLYSKPESVGTINDVLAIYDISSDGSGAGKFNNWSQVRI